MSKVIELSDEQYQTIQWAAATRGQTLVTLLAQWIEDLRNRDREPHYYETEEWFRHLGASEEQMSESALLASGHCTNGPALSPQRWAILSAHW